MLELAGWDWLAGLAVTGGWVGRLERMSGDDVLGSGTVTGIWGLIVAPFLWNFTVVTRFSNGYFQIQAGLCLDFQENWAQIFTF